MRALLLAALLAAPAALACDPAEMEAAMTEICRGATSGAAEALDALPGGHALRAELAAIERRCAESDPAAAARDAARLAARAGRLAAQAAWRAP